MNDYTAYPGSESLMLTLCLEENSILVSKAILETLGHPRQIQMLINEERQMLLLQACTVEDREAVVVPPDPQLHFEMSGCALLKRIRRLTGWSDNLPRAVYGNYLPTHHAIVFDLHTAQIVQIPYPMGRLPGRIN